MATLLKIVKVSVDCDLPKRIKSKIDGRVYDLEFEVQYWDGFIRYVIWYPNHDWQEAAFLVDSHDGFDFNTLRKKMEKDVNWCKC